jgi:hypothetical protein
MQVTEDEWDAVAETVVKDAPFGFQYAARQILARDSGGSIINRREHHQHRRRQRNPRPPRLHHHPRDQGRPHDDPVMLLSPRRERIDGI